MGLFSRFIGKDGEEQAVMFLKKKHYKILTRNYRTYYGEIDIVAKIKETIVFVEVKSRKNDTMGRPEEWVTYQKRKKIVSAAKKYISANELNEKNFRFDVIAILDGEITHLENVFDENA